MKTIRQIANSLGIDKQRIYRYIRKNYISEVHQKNGVMYYDEDAQTLIQRHFQNIRLDGTNSEKSLASTSFDVLLKQFELLTKELEIKNEQIKDLNLRLSETTSALVIAQQSAQAAQALHAGTIKKQLSDSVSPIEPDMPVKGFFARLLRHKSL